MPNRWAVANGNWSSAATWSGSLIPTASDDVFANNFTVNVDTSFQVLSIRNTASASAVAAGGTFNFNSGSISGSCTRVVDNTSLVPGATNLVQVTATSGTVTLSIGSSVAAPAVASTLLITHTGNCDFVLNGISFTGGNSGVGNLCINKTSVGTITITGNLFAGASGGGGSTALSTTAGNTIIIGSVTGGSGTAASPAISQTVGNLTITGSLLGGGTTAAVAFTGTSLNISGSVVGGSGTVGLACSSAATINVIGPITPGASTAAISSTGAHALTYSGSLASSAGSPAIISSNASATNIFTGPFINTNDTMAVQCVDMVLTADASTTWNFGNITLFSPERLAYYPSASDIRQDTTYADGTVSGSLKMPPPSAVIAGTPTDNTTGSAVLTPTQLQDAVWGRDLSQMTETGSIGHRLARASTTGTTGAQIASYLL